MAAQPGPPLSSQAEGSVHRDPYPAAHGDAIDKCHVGLVQTGDEVVQAVLGAEEPAARGWVGRRQAAVGGQGAGNLTAKSARPPGWQAGVRQAGQRHAGWMAGPKPSWAGAPQCVIEPPLKPQLHHCLDIAAGAKRLLPRPLNRHAVRCTISAKFVTPECSAIVHCKQGQRRLAETEASAAFRSQNPWQPGCQACLEQDARHPRVCFPPLVQV